MRPKPTNLLFVFSDQHRWCDLGCYGNPDVPTPNLDAFAAKGLRFNQCYSNCPLCVPARGSLLTGLHAMQHGAIANDLPIRTDLESIGTVLNQGGYHSGYIGKWHLAGVPRDQVVAPADRLGFQTWKVRQCSHDYLHPEYHDEAGALHQVPGYEPAIQTDLARDFIDTHTAEPWGLILSWGPPHDLYHEVSDEYLKRFDPDNIELRPNVPEVIQHTKNSQKTRAEIREWLAGYYAQITALDEQFGRLIEKLKTSGQWEHTLVVYTSDHGDLLGSQGKTRKQLPHEESARIPLIIGGGLHNLRQGVCDELIGFVDLAPTTLGALGLSFESAIAGADLSQLLFDPAAKGLDELYLYNPVPCHHSEDRGDGSWRAIRKGRYTFALNLEDEGDWFLYDNEADPYQMNNLIDRDDATKQLARELRQRVIANSERFDAPLPWPELLRQYNLVDAWNKSQRWFNRAELKD